MKSIIVFIILNVCIGSIFGKSTNTCKEIPKSKGVDPHLNKKLNSEGRFIPVHKKIEGFGPKSADDVSPKTDDEDAKETPKKEACFDLETKTPYGNVDLPLKCKYYDKGVRCATRSSAPAAPDQVPTGFVPNFDGVYAMTKTDNSTYKVYVGCFSKVEPFWAVVATSSELKSTVRDEIFKHIEKFGFKSEDASSPANPVILEEFKPADCNKDPTGNPMSAIMTGLEMVEKQTNKKKDKDGKKQKGGEEEESDK